MMNNIRNNIKDFWIFIKRRVKNHPEFPLVLGMNRKGNYTIDDKVVNATLIGDKRTITFLTVYDLQEHQLAGDFSNAKYLEHLSINAVYILEETYKRLNEWNAQVSYQPMFVQL